MQEKSQMLAFIAVKFAIGFKSALHSICSKIHENMPTLRVRAAKIDLMFAGIPAKAWHLYQIDIYGMHRFKG